MVSMFNKQHVQFNQKYYSLMQWLIKQSELVRRQYFGIKRLFNFINVKKGLQLLYIRIILKR